MFMFGRLSLLLDLKKYDPEIEHTPRAQRELHPLNIIFEIANEERLGITSFQMHIILLHIFLCLMSGQIMLKSILR